MTNEEARLGRIAIMERAIYGAYKKHGNCIKKKLFALFMYETGCSLRKAQEYLTMLINGDKVEETAGVLTWKDE